MKKLLFLFIITIGLSGQSYAQSEAPYILGLKLGLNLNTLSFNSDSFKTGMSTGWNIGYSSFARMSRTIYIFGDVSVSKVGGKLTYYDRVRGQEETAKFSYFNLDWLIMGGYGINDKITVRAGINITLQSFGSLLKFEDPESQSLYGGGFIQNTDYFDYRITNMRSASEGAKVGLTFGIGYQLSEKIFLESRYELGLSNYYPKNYEGVKPYKTSQRYLQTSIAFLFPKNF
ncbi:MAG: outer membrane beta-barrel protein [Bacteroidia bacterium]|nr:outer membrane beta-barrel protein [Bacteroidia bacterium]